METPAEPNPIPSSKPHAATAHRLRWRLVAIFVAAIAFATPPAAGSAESPDLHWPEFRGPSRDGHAPKGSSPPVSWGEAENVRFRTELPGEGWSSPVVGEGKVWMTTALDGGRERLVLAVDAQSGEVVHRRVVFEVPEPEPKNPLNSFASPSPVLAPGRVYVHFGSNGTACLDAKTGETIWERRDLPCDHEQGPGASPMWSDGLLVVNMDGVDLQYVVALDGETGETRWKTSRTVDLASRPPTMRKAYSTPILVDVEGETRLVSSGAEATVAYAPRTGEELWSVRHSGFSMSSRPILGDRFVFLNTGYMRPSLVAVNPAGRGDVTEAEGDLGIVWSTDKGVPTMASPIHVDGRIYMAGEKGMLTVVDADTGAMVTRKRIRGKFYASPVYAGGRLYFTNREGRTFVVAPGEEAEVLSVNTLDSGCMASPAVVGDAIFLRTETHLLRIEAPAPDANTATDSATEAETKDESTGE